MGHKKPPKPKNSPLQNRIRLSTPAPSTYDRKDSDLSSYVEPFLHSLRKDITLERVDLSTEASAAESLNYLSNKLEVLQQKLHHTRQLRRLLEEEKFAMLQKQRKLDD